MCSWPWSDSATRQALVASSTNTFDPRHRQTDINHANAFGSLAAYHYQLDAGDRIAHADLPDGSVDYTNDDTNQLTSSDFSFQPDQSDST